MEFSQRPLGFMKFLQNNNHQAVNKTKILHFVTFQFGNYLMNSTTTVLLQGQFWH